MRPDSKIQWQSYPALGLAACLAAGIATAHVLEVTGPRHGMALMSFGCALVVVLSFAGRRRLVSPVPLLHTLGIVIIVAGLGALRLAAWKALPPHHIGHLVETLLPDAGPILVQGRIVDEPRKAEGHVRFVVHVRHLVVGPDTLSSVGRVRVSLTTSRRRPTGSFPDVAMGDVVGLRGRIRPVSFRRNPADFDGRGYLHRQGIYATLTVYEAEDVDVFHRERSWIEHVVTVVRHHLRRQIERCIASKTSRSVLTALVLGDRSGLDEAVRSQFARTGLMHLLAISGLHVGLVGMLFYKLLLPLLIRAGIRWRTMELTRACATMLLLVLYMLVAGAGPSVVRAVTMAGLFLAGTFLQRSSNTLNTLGAAALVLLLVRPTHLFEVGFQLSFAAVAAIVCLHPIMYRRLPARWKSHKLAGSTLSVVSVSVAATLGTMPVLLYHFGEVAFAGVVLNLTAIPLTVLALSSGLLALALGGWAATPAGILGAASDLLIRALVATATAGDAWLGRTVLEMHLRDPFLVMALVVALLALAQWPRPRTRWRLAALALGLTATGLWTGVLSGAYRPHLELVFFDVGHGDAVLVTLPGGKRLLIDTGHRDGHVDAATRTILPHLDRFDISHLDAVLVTHPHSDHLGGLPGILRSVSVGQVLHNGQAFDSALYDEVRHLVDSLKVPQRAVGTGDTLNLDPNVRLYVLAPDSALLAEGEANDASVVLRLVYGRTRMLFTGDAERTAEHRTLGRYAAVLPSDVIKVGHHGSRTSSTPRFVRQVVPDSTRRSLAVVSVGERFGLPDEDILDRWERAGAGVWITAQRGALWLRCDGKRVRRVRWR